MAAAKERLLEWLRDAHAMEQQAETMLSSTASRLENYPELKSRLEQHLEETKRQAEMLAECLKRLGGGTSVVKDATGKFVAFAQGMSGMFVGDEVVKGAMASYTFEHFEISSYRCLIAAAEDAGDAQTKQVCETILHQEEDMAKWLFDNLPAITSKYLARDEEPGVTAKH
ncbi:MAG: ferritin-like domain-containing protein [Beijerinckiaceae bacterium]|nr:ferritin-like domain-containing protein [Beijerinckiaceae bacterium]